MWVVTATGGYVNLDVLPTASVVALNSGPHAGQYAVRLGSGIDAAYFTTESAATDALVALLDSVGTTSMEGDV